MRMTAHGKGDVGGGLADPWERAGHHVTRLKRRGPVGGLMRQDKTVIVLSNPKRGRQ